MMSMSGRWRAPLALASVLFLATACGGADDVPVAPAAAPSPAADEPSGPGLEDDEVAGGEAHDPALAAEAMAAVAMPFSEGRDPFEPVRDLTDTPVETADEGAAVPAAPAAAAPADPPTEPAPPAPTPEPSAGTCDADLAGCLESLRLLDAGPGVEGPAVFQLGTTLYEVELGAGFADAFILLRLEDGCATVAHRDGVAERCVEPDSSLK